MNRLYFMVLTGIIFLLVPMTATAAVNQWSGTGPFATGLGNRVITALAVSADGKTVYSGTGSGTVFSYAVTPPTVTTNAASGIGAIGATLNATVNANNADTTVSFAYGGTTSYGSSSAATPATVTGAADTATSAVVTGLIPGATYHYRAVAVSSSGTTYGDDLSFTLDKAATSTALSSSPNPSTFGQSVTFTATVTSGVGTPTGSVTFRDGTTGLGSGTLNASGQATFNTSALSVGNHSITAVYDGDTNYVASTSATLTQTVNEPPSITSANNTSFSIGSAGSFTITTNGYPAPALSETGALPTGVAFIDSGNGTATLSGTPAAGTVGTYPITITAANGIGTAATQAFTLTVYPAINGSIIINSGAGYTRTAAVTLVISASEASGTISSMQFSNDSSAWSAWENYAINKSYTLPTGDGVKTVYVRFKDATRALSQAFSDTITLDTTPPTCSLTINSGAGYTNSYSVTLNISAADNLSSVASMQFSSNKSTWTSWENFAATRKYTLLTNSSGTGNTVYARMKDGAANVSAICSASIKSTRQPPRAQ
jgi:hypothetical protein